MRAVGLLILALAGCGDSLVFPCTDEAQCVRSGKHGACVLGEGAASRYCAFEDTGCPSRKRFDPTAGEGLAGRCVGGTGADLGIGFDEDGGGGDPDLAMEAQPDLSGPPAELHWQVVNASIASDLWCVGGYDDAHVWVGGPVGIWFSGDNGKTFVRQPLPQNADSITGVWAENHRVWAVNHATQILYSSDDGAHWSVQPAPNTVADRLYAIWGSSASNLFIAGHGGVMLHSDDGMTWREQNVSGNNVGYLNSVWGSSQDDIWSTGGSGVAGVRSPMAHSTNGGSSWSVGSLPSDLIMFRMWGSSATDIYAVGEQQVIYHSVGGGFTELRKATGVPDDAFYAVWGSGPDDVIVSGTSGLLIRSTDGGKSWREQASGSSSDLTAVWGSRRDNVYVVGSGGTILHGTP